MKSRRWSRGLIVVLIVAGLYLLRSNGFQTTPPADERSVETQNTDALIGEAFRNRESGVLVEGAGTVEKILSDDLEGSRHQRLILRLESGLTLLVSHNIDLAPRVQRMQVGDRLEFRGQYEWSERGGTIHWTHHDPRGLHPGGWLRHQGVVYE